MKSNKIKVYTEASKLESFVSTLKIPNQFFAIANKKDKLNEKGQRLDEVPYYVYSVALVPKKESPKFIKSLKNFLTQKVSAHQIENFIVLASYENTSKTKDMVMVMTPNPSDAEFLEQLNYRFKKHDNQVMVDEYSYCFEEDDIKLLPASKSLKKSLTKCLVQD